MWCVVWHSFWCFKVNPATTHRAAGTLGRVWGIVLLLDDLTACQPVLRGSQSVCQICRDWARACFLPFFTWQFVSKLMKSVSQKSLEISNFRIKSVEKHSHEQDLGKDLVSKGSNLWNWQRLHTFSCFSRGPVLPKSNQNWSQNGMSGHSKSQKSKNKDTQNNSYLARPQKVYF